MDQKTFCLHQKQLIERAKWQQGTREGKDPGHDFVIKWVEENASRYREEYEECFKELIKKTAEVCLEQLRVIVPSVSEEMWFKIFEIVIEEFTKIWTVELVLTSDEQKKKHLEEI